MTDRASAEGLLPASAKLLRDFDRGAIDYSELAARLWLIEREAALRDTGPRPDSDPWPDLDGADTSDSGHPHDGYAYDGCACVCCVNVRALSTPRTDTSDG